MKAKRFPLLIILLAAGLFIIKFYQLNAGEKNEPVTIEIKADTVHPDTVHQSDTTIMEHNADSQHVEEQQHGENSHSADMSPLLFVIIALIVGAGTRHLFRKSFLPYTVLLLIIGLALGVLNRVGVLEGALLPIGKAFEWAGHIDPHLILYIFLPTLIFEAAFAMDVYTFRKTSVNSFILAVPGILVALFLTGALVIGLDVLGIGMHNWGWSMALMFGAVVSATDPVAVVALLKELGASKKLSTLIEGESLLNDGTAIVFFMVFFMAITGVVGGQSPFVQFLWVSFGGIGLGIIVGILTINWVKKVFNDALVEISVIVAAAYLTFYVAESFMHVSGVLGLVSYGLSMAGRGRTRISPEVEHFLHEFWELAAFIANTLIFIIVGMVIAQRTNFKANDFIILGILYIGIHIVRAIMIFMFYPLMKRAGYGLAKKDAYVLWYGALRGAIALALALVVAGVDDKYISAEIKDQFLFLTAGLVTLTLLINATTIKFIVDKLGLTKIPAEKALMMQNAQQYIIQSARNAKERLKTDRFMGHADWKEVERYMFKEEVLKTEGEADLDTMAETRRRILEKEKASYWSQFQEGLIGPRAVRNLTEQIKEVIDQGGKRSLADRKDLESSWKTPKLLDKLQGVPILGKVIENFYFDMLSVSYDSASGFIQAQEEVLKLIESMYNSLAKEEKTKEIEELKEIESEVNENKIHGLTFLRLLKKNYPEIYDAISTRQAIRTLLNHELKTVERLHSNGRIDSVEMAKMVSDIEERMKRLMEKPPRVKPPDTEEILKTVSWLNILEPSQFKMATGMFQKRVYAVGESITKAGTVADSIYIIIRGTARVEGKDDTKSLLGPGDTLGELSVMTGTPRNYTITAVSPVTALRIKIVKLVKLLNEFPVVRLKLWEIAGKRYAVKALSEIESYNVLPKKQLLHWINKGEVSIAPEGNIEIKDKVIILLEGEGSEILKSRTKSFAAPQVLTDGTFSFSKGAFIYVSPDKAAL